MHTTIKSVITEAAAKALATDGPAGINVVPVSMIKVNDDGSVWLFDFFMEKTVQNLATNSAMALTCWSGMEGIQLKAMASYLTDGPDFAAAVDWVATQNPDRVVKGLIVLKPTVLYDISPGGIYDDVQLTLP